MLFLAIPSIILGFGIYNYDDDEYIKRKLEECYDELYVCYRELRIYLEKEKTLCDNRMKFLLVKEKTLCDNHMKCLFYQKRFFKREDNKPLTEQLIKMYYILYYKLDDSIIHHKSVLLKKLSLKPKPTHLNNNAIKKQRNLFFDSDREMKKIPNVSRRNYNNTENMEVQFLGLINNLNNEGVLNDEETGILKNIIEHENYNKIMAVYDTFNQNQNYKDLIQSLKIFVKYLRKRKKM
jgi:hypothetical protein